MEHAGDVCSHPLSAYVSYLQARFPGDLRGAALLISLAANVAFTWNCV